MASSSKSSSKTGQPKTDTELAELKHLLVLLESPVSKKQVLPAESKQSSGKVFQWPISHPKSTNQDPQSKEAVELEKFGNKYGSRRVFHNHAHHDRFKEIFTLMNKQRLCCPEWIASCPTENILRILVCLRIMLRDGYYQKMFFQNEGAKTLAEYFNKATDSYLFYGDGHLVVEILKEMTNIFQKLASSQEQREWLIVYNVHRSLVLLLLSSDVLVLHCSLHALISLAESKPTRILIGEMNSIEHLLKILQDYDDSSKKLAASLLRVLCVDTQSRELVKVYDGIPLFLSLLHNNNIKLLWHIVWCLVQLAEDQDSSNDIRHMGGIPIIISLLHDRQFAIEAETPKSAELPALKSKQASSQPLSSLPEYKEQILSLKSACCACLTELVLNDTNAHQIVQNNGIYAVGLLILPTDPALTGGNKKESETLQRNALRTMRFLFSMERNRRLFQRLFPPTLYELFIDCGHYVRDLKTYQPLVEKINQLPNDTLDEIRDNICASDQNKTPTHFIGDYAVLELLGTGAFGCVYRVKKRTSAQSYLAMKEIQTAQIVGKKRDQAKSIGDIINEITIIKEQLKHPNIVRYYKTFVENTKLYIVMELIEGAPLGEHFASLKEKGEKFSEDTVWRIFIQILLALRYLHKEKNIVHRDLSPNNIMLGENFHVTITDFGLAKQKSSEASRMHSFVGTVLYSCPEIIQNLPYGEKADIWALGCILYQMCALKPPFYSTNLIHLAKSIVQAEYDPLPKGDYSKRVENTIRLCLEPEADKRADVVEIASHVADIMLSHLDIAQMQQIALEKKLERERKRTRRHYFEASRNAQNYHRLFLISQERQDRLASSGGAASLKEEYSDTSDTESLGHRRANNRGQLDSLISDPEEDGMSSSAASRVSSAGSVRSFEMDGTLKADENEKEEKNKQRRKLDNPLRLDIPTSSPSSEPSPLAGMSPSSSRAHELYRRQISDSGSESGVTRRSALKPNPASPATLTISPHKVRQINDPILQMLHQLHKIIYITQLPPSLCPNQRRRYIDKFKRALFAPQSTSFNLKSELKKLLMGSREPIDLDFGPYEPSYMSRQVSSESDYSQKSGSSASLEISRHGMDYEQMQSIIESVLVESGYYDVTNNVTSPYQSLRERDCRPVKYEHF